jgi:hypothetical protein
MSPFAAFLVQGYGDEVGWVGIQAFELKKWVPCLIDGCWLALVGCGSR